MSSNLTPATNLIVHCVSVVKTHALTSMDESESQEVPERQIVSGDLAPYLEPGDEVFYNGFGGLLSNDKKYKIEKVVRVEDGSGYRIGIRQGNRVELIHHGYLDMTPDDIQKLVDRRNKPEE